MPFSNPPLEPQQLGATSQQVGSGAAQQVGAGASQPQLGAASQHPRFNKPKPAEAVVAERLIAATATKAIAIKRRMC
ncbi:MAG: hypothetical protein SGI77_26245 [Pirellulaceae bacterium]|nr:hypothetical protein [Pirellulaceae bacterium]